MSSIFPDVNTEFGAKVRSRLENEHIVWLTTVNGRGIPQPNPVWFTWQGVVILTYNLAGSARVRNVRTRPEVSLHFNQTDGAGGVVVLTGTARVLNDATRADNDSSFVAKYERMMPYIGHDAASFAEMYSAPIAIDVSRVRGA